MYFAISFIGTILTQTAVQNAEVYRLLFRPWPYIGVMLTNTVATAALTILFVVYLNGGVLGFFIGNTTGSLVAAVVGWSAIRGFLDWSKWHRDWWPRLMHFGVPGWFLPVYRCIS